MPSSLRLIFESTTYILCIFGLILQFSSLKIRNNSFTQSLILLMRKLLPLNKIIPLPFIPISSLYFFKGNSMRVIRFDPNFLIFSINRSLFSIFKTGYYIIAVTFSYSSSNIFNIFTTFSKSSFISYDGSMRTRVFSFGLIFCKKNSKPSLL